jgi:hypothetical protein
MIIKREGLSGIFNKTHLDLEVKNDGKKGRHKRRRSRHSESKALVSLQFVPLFSFFNHSLLLGFSTMTGLLNLHLI